MVRYVKCISPPTLPHQSTNPNAPHLMRGPNRLRAIAQRRQGNGTSRQKRGERAGSRLVLSIRTCPASTKRRCKKWWKRVAARKNCHRIRFWRKRRINPFEGKVTNLKLKQVFTPGGQPSITYVSRDHLQLETAVKEAFARGFAIIVVTGPTKSGKTVLCNHVLAQQGKSVSIEGGQVRNEADFWTQLAHDIDIGGEKFRVPFGE